MMFFQDLVEILSVTKCGLKENIVLHELKNEAKQFVIYFYNLGWLWLKKCINK